MQQKLSRLSNQFKGCCFSLVLSMVCLSISWGSEPVGYRVLIPVQERVSHPKAEFFKEPLTQALKRMTKNPNISQLPPIQALLSKADQWVIQYGFEESPQGLFLSVVFDEEALGTWLKTHKIEWVKSQVKVLLWLTFNGQTLYALSEKQQQEWIQNFKKVAQEMGVSLLFPSQDLEGLQAMNANDATVRQAWMKQYETPLLWVVQLEERQGQWFLDAQLSGQGKEGHWNLQQMSKETLIAESLQAMMKKLSEETPSVPEQNAQEFYLTVQGMQAQDDYQKVLEYLKTIPGVQAIEMISIQGVEVVYRLKSSKDRIGLVEWIEKEEKLIPTQRPEGQRLFYQLRS